MRRFSDRQTFDTLTEINVTPLLDLAFVLLIIFIITTPLMEKSVNLEVPTSGEANQSVDSSAVQTIGIDRENVITLNDEIVDLSTLESRLISLHEEKPEAPVIIRPNTTGRSRIRPQTRRKLFLHRHQLPRLRPRSQRILPLRNRRFRPRPLRHQT